MDSPLDILNGIALAFHHVDNFLVDSDSWSAIS